MKIDKPSARLTKKQREKNQINKIRNKNAEITTDNTEIQRIITDYYQQLYDNKMDNLEEKGKFLEKYNLPKLSQEEIHILTRPILQRNQNCNKKKSSNKQKKVQDQTIYSPLWLHWPPVETEHRMVLVWGGG